MPLYYFRCVLCDAEHRKVMTPVQARGLTPSCNRNGCLGQLRREPKGISTNVIERLDAPHMLKAVERPANAESLYRERAAADMRLPDETTVKIK
jgi:hypothetical protein